MRLLEDKVDGEGERPLYSGLVLAQGPDQGLATTENKGAEWPGPQKLIHKLR